MSESFIIEVENLDNLLNNKKINTELLIPISSQGFDGVSLSAAIVAISTAGITAIAKIVIESIKQKSKIKLKYQDKDISIELDGVSEEKIIENFKEISYSKR